VVLLSGCLAAFVWLFRHQFYVVLCCVLNKNTCLFADIGGNSIGNSWIVAGAYQGISQQHYHVMASFMGPTKYCISYNEESPEALLPISKKLQELAPVLAWLHRSSRVIQQNNYISDKSNYDAIGVTNRI